MIPIILVVSYYINLQIDTIHLQTSYDTKLQESAKEAISALEINTVQWNPNFSNLADSKRRDVQASINTFLNSLANKMEIGGTSKEYMLNYVPAIAYTMYDGYYTYGNDRTYNYKEDENGAAEISTTGQLQNGARVALRDNNNNDITYTHLLQSFTPYSETLTSKTNENIVVTINYTLDNYVRVYYSDSSDPFAIRYNEYEGYLIDTDSIINKVDINNMTYNGYKITNGENLSERIDDNEGIFTYVYDENNNKIYFNSSGNPFKLDSNNEKISLSDLQTTIYKKIIDNTTGKIYRQALNVGSERKNNRKYL
jgi:hypothetical protein